MSQILGISWLKSDPLKFVCGSDNGDIKMYDVEAMIGNPIHILYHRPTNIRLSILDNN